jgi:hypothetical protein
MEETSYNGWRNYPTWAVALWLGDDPAEPAATLTRTWHDLSAEHGGTLSDLADALRTFIIEGMDALEKTAGSLAGDLLGFALGEVDWLELATTYARDHFDGDEEGFAAELERRRAAFLAETLR